jgi:hypothetical protein
MAALPTPGVARIVKLGAETLLITRIESGQGVPEGEYEVRAIAAVPVEGPSGADICEAKVTCTSNCVVRVKVDDEMIAADGPIDA